MDRKSDPGKNRGDGPSLTGKKWNRYCRNKVDGRIYIYIIIADSVFLSIIFF